MQRNYYFFSKPYELCTKLKLKIDKRHNFSTFHLNNNKNSNTQQDSFCPQGHIGDYFLQGQIRFSGDEMYDVACHHQDENHAVARHKLQEDLRFEAGENPRQYFACFRHRVGAEKYPRETYDMKRENGTYHSFQGGHTCAVGLKTKDIHQKLMYRQRNAVNRAP